MCIYLPIFFLDKDNKDQPRLGSRRNTFSQPIITDKGDGTHDVSYVPPPVGDPYEVGYPQYLSIPTSWPSSIKNTPNNMLKLALISMHSIWHKAYFSSNTYHTWACAYIVSKSKNTMGNFMCYLSERCNENYMPNFW